VVVAAEMLHYAGIVLAMAFSACGVAYGQGYAGGWAIVATTRQDLAFIPVWRALLIGLAFIESGGIFALVLSLLFVKGYSFTPTVASGLAVAGAGAGIGIASWIVGIASGRVVAAATGAIARQPFFAEKVLQLMMLAQILLEAPAVFALVIGITIYSKITAGMSLIFGWQLFAGGLLIALGSIGPAIGQAIFSSAACRASGVNIKMYPRIFSFALLTQAIIETPIIFCLLLAILLIIRTISVTPLIEGVSLLMGSTIAFGFGCTGAAVGSGYVAARAVTLMVQEPKQYTILLRVTILCQAIIDTALIYSLITAFLMIKQCV